MGAGGEGVVAAASIVARKTGEAGLDPERSHRRDRPCSSMQYAINRPVVAAACSKCNSRRPGHRLIEMRDVRGGDPVPDRFVSRLYGHHGTRTLGYVEDLPGHLRLLNSTRRLAVSFLRKRSLPEDSVWSYSVRCRAPQGKQGFHRATGRRTLRLAGGHRRSHLADIRSRCWHSPLASPRSGHRQIHPKRRCLRSRPWIDKEGPCGEMLLSGVPNRQAYSRNEYPAGMTTVRSSGGEFQCLASDENGGRDMSNKDTSDTSTPTDVHIGSRSNLLRATIIPTIISKGHNHNQPSTDPASLRSDSRGNNLRYRASFSQGT